MESQRVEIRRIQISVLKSASVEFQFSSRKSKIPFQNIEDPIPKSESQKGEVHKSEKVEFVETESQRVNS